MARLKNREDRIPEPEKPKEKPLPPNQPPRISGAVLMHNGERYANVAEGTEEKWRGLGFTEVE